ncbi:autophagy-related protein-like protein 22 [Sporormia fimetaria CBS 119925]|uniref:Autophagy-related protein n=1 Tax=Sporormia fimetaria CBS 119925 TaxID=1340428 RepID=A0A6A6VF24_9PLEO|nr:autophagy-related protein-like protein 22 [Sporormia fimetaria CBS 119925]
MSFDEVVRPRRHVRYGSEDTSPTTSQELRGWYSYTIAAEVFAVVGVGSFLPVTLEQLARERGVFYSERSKSCIASLGRNGTVSHMQARADGGTDTQCIVNFLGSDITTSSFAMYTFSAAVLVQAVTLICLSSFADHGPYRKKMLMTFAYTGSMASALFIFIPPTVFFLAPLLVIIGVTCLGSSFSLLNAFLPLLVSNYEDSNENDPTAPFEEREALNPEPSAPTTHTSSPRNLECDLERSAKISSKGVGLGYIAALLVQCFSILILFISSKTSISKQSPSLPMRFILLLAGIWWALFSIPTLLFLRPRPGPPLPSRSTANRTTRLRTAFFYIRFSLSSFLHTLKLATRLRQVVIFLIAWFLLSDAVATVSGIAMLFARTELKLSAIQIALLSITSLVSGILGAFTWPRIATRHSLSPKSVLLSCILLMELVPLYGLLGYVPFIAHAGVGGLQQPWEIYPLGALHGFVMGGISSYSRAVFAPLIPEGREAAFFALFAVTDKGSSAVGPALVGRIVDTAGTIRPAFIFLAVLAVLPAPFVWWLDVERGRESARVLALGKGRSDEGGSVDEEMRETLMRHER